MPLFTSGNIITGGNEADFLIGVAGAGPDDSRIDGGSGNDVIYGDAAAVVTAAGVTPATGPLLTALSGWQAVDHKDVGNSAPGGGSLPFLTTFVAPQQGQYAYYRVTVAAGQRIALDIDYADNGPRGIIPTHLAIMSGAAILAQSNSDTGSIDGGTGGGSLRGSDASLVHTFAAAGTFVIRVGYGNGNSFPEPGVSFLLHTILTGQPESGRHPAGDDSLSGGDGNDSILGMQGQDSLYGGDGDDYLDGGAGRDSIFGGVGDDVIYQRGPNDVAFGGRGNDQLHAQGGQADMGAGNDYVSVDYATGGLFFGGEGQDWLAVTGDFSGVRMNMSSGVMTINGFGVFSDFEHLDDRSSGGNFLTGNGDDNTLVGGRGADVIRGLAGIDTAYYAYSQGAVGIDLSGGFGTGGEAEGDILSGIENAYGSRRADEITGSGVANTLWGQAGDDFLDGLGGNDLLLGENGDDILYGRNGDDRIEGQSGSDTAFGGDGNDDIVNTTGADLYYGGAGNDVLSGGIAAEWFFGGAANDQLYGGSGADTLEGDGGDDLIQSQASDAVVIRGGAGRDNILSGSGSDWIDAGDGDDLLDGRAGNNTIYGGAGNDSLSAAEGDDSIFGGDGNDSIQALTGANSVDAGAGDDTVYGGAGADRILGGEGNDRLLGLGGADTLSGGAGNDLLAGGVGGQTLNGGEGADRASYQFSEAAVTIRLWNNTGQGGDAQGDVLSSIEDVEGTIFADVLIGRDAEANSLFGGSGDDFLDGLGGSDHLHGGLGRDTVGYSGSAQGVTVRLWNGTGQGGSAQGDTLDTIENLIGSNHADVLIGSDPDGNTLTGGAGNDYLDGLAGNDRLDGGTGNDTLAGGAGTDQFVFARLYGFDVVTAFQDGTDRVDLTGGLTFADLSLSQGAMGVLVTINGSLDDEVLELRGVTLAQVGNADFI